MPDPVGTAAIAKVDPWLWQRIAEENSAQMRKDIVAWVGTSAARFRQVVSLVLHGSRVQAQRASYPMSFVVEAQPQLGIPQVLSLLANLHRSDIHGAVIRNTMRMLRFVPLKAEYEAEIFSAAMAAVSGPVEIAVKSDAISILARLVQRFPEMRAEIELVIRSGLPGAAPAYRVRAKKEFGLNPNSELEL